MPRYRIIHDYTSTVIYEVDAESEEAACDLVNGLEPPEPVESGLAEFSDERVEEIV